MDSDGLNGSIGNGADTPDGLMFSDDNGDNGTDATDRRAVLAIAMETFSEKKTEKKFVKISIVQRNI